MIAASTKWAQQNSFRACELYMHVATVATCVNDWHVFLNLGRLIVVAATLGLDAGCGGGSGGDETGSTNTSDILTTISINETLFSLSNNSQSVWSTSAAPTLSAEITDDDVGEVVVVAERLEADEDHPCQNVLQLLLVVKTILLAFALLLEILMARLALRGTMWDVQPRRLMEYVLYSRLRTLTVETKIKTTY